MWDSSPVKGDTWPILTVTSASAISGCTAKTIVSREGMNLGFFMLGRSLGCVDD
jgi:hypothetical protein